MNFIGHLVVARWQRPDAGFGLGAMLPDFASMAGVRLATVPDADIAAGVALHHRTDETFHSAPAFVALMQEAVSALRQAGVERGPSRAVAHIGVELLLDGLLIRRPDVGDAYVSALAAFGALPSARFAQPDEGPWRRLQARLISHGIPYDYERPEAVTTRLISILARRPSLALSDAAAGHVGSMLPDLKARVIERSEELLSQLAHGLSNRRYSSTITG